jgi:hypothetical protein
MRKRVASEMTLHQSVVMLEDSFDSRRGEAKDVSAFEDSAVV